jgi:vacuolar-type H+-ATPase subunit D/Vma8
MAITAQAAAESRAIELTKQLATEKTTVAAQLEAIAGLKAALAEARETAEAKTAELIEVCESIDRLTQQVRQWVGGWVGG